MEAKTLNATMASHPLAETENRLKELQIIAAFDQWIEPSAFNKWHLCLYRFATEKPLSYVNSAAIDETLNMLKANRKFAPAALTTHAQEISQAIFSLLRPGSSWGKEQSLSLDTPDDFSDFESIWHPEYIRYCEQIYNHLIQIHLEILGKIHQKHYADEVALANRVKTLSSFGLGTLVDGYNSVVRNSISHGHVAFGLFDVTYTDKNKTEVLDAQEFGNLFDFLVDTCHSIVIAVLLFICEERQEFEKAGLANLPLGIRFLFVDGFTYHKGTRILSLIENQIGSSKKQINISCRIETKVRQAQMFEAFFIGWATSVFGGGQYDRYAISIDCGKPSIAMIIFKGDALHQAIEKNETLAVSGPRIIETSLLWYDAPNIESYIYNLKNLIPTQWVILKDKLNHIFKDAGLKILSQDYKIVHIKNTSPRKLRRLEAHLILNHNGSTTPEKLFETIAHAFNKLQKVHIRVKDFEGEKGLPGRPDYIIIRLYSVEKRLRKLETYFWKDKELVLIAEWNNNWKNAPPYATRDDVDIIRNNMRIKFNKQLIKVI